MGNLLSFSQTTYCRVNGRCDKYLIENYLLPGLEKQAKIAGGSRGVELPSSTLSPEYISLDEAKKMVVDYLDSTENLLTRDKKVLLSLTNYGEFARYAQLVYSNRVTDPHKLLTATRISNLESYRKHKFANANSSSPKFDPGQIFDEYNHLYFKLLKYSQVGVPGNILSTLLPKGLDSNQVNLTKQLLTQIICSNFDRLLSAGSVGHSDEIRDFAVTSELFNIIKSEYPDANGLLNFINDRQAGKIVRQYVTRIKVGFFDNSSTNFDKYKQIQAAASAGVTDFIPSQQALVQEIAAALPPNLNPKEKDLLARSLVSQIVSSASTPLNSDQILLLAIKQISKKLNLSSTDHNSLLLIHSSLRASGIDAVIEYRQNEMALLIQGHTLTRAELKLIKMGINPFYAFKSQLKLKQEARDTITEYNKTHNLAGKDSISSLAELEKYELALPKPNLNTLRKVRSLRDHEYFYSNLTPQQRRLLNRTRMGRYLLELRSGVHEAQRMAWDKWFDFEDLITGKKLTNYLIDRWEGFASTFTLPGTKIPIFRFFPWLSEEFRALKKTYVKAIIARTSQGGGLGTLINWSFRQYELGDYTLGGAIASVRKQVWSTTVKWTISKVGLSGVFKYGNLSTSRTLNRLLINIGGKQLARIGARVIPTLLALTSVIGVVATIISAVQLVFDFLKLGWELAKNFFSNTDFREGVILAGAALTAIVTSFSAVLLGFVGGIAALISGAFFNLALSLLFGVGLVFTTSFIQKNIQQTFYLDVSSGITEVISNAVCSITGAAPDPNSTPAANAAQCIYELLQRFSINPLTQHNAQGAAWANFVAALGNDSATSIIQTSAIGQGVFQCVGFIAGVGAIIGKAFNPTNACLYVNNPPPGYTWTTQPKAGCFFVVGSKTCSQCGQPNAPANSCGHVGVVTNVKGVIIEGSDANGTVPWGSVRIKAQFPTSSIAGYMCP